MDKKVSINHYDASHRYTKDGWKYWKLTNEHPVDVNGNPDIKAGESIWVLELDVSGFTREQLKVKLTGNLLTIGGRKECDEIKGTYLTSRSRFSFEQSWSLKFALDKDDIKVSYIPESLEEQVTFVEPTDRYPHIKPEGKLRLEWKYDTKYLNSDEVEIIIK